MTYTLYSFLKLEFAYNLHVYLYNNRKMKMLFFLLLLFIVFNKNDIHHSYLLIFTGQGTFYKLNLQSKYVEWYSALQTNLIDFSIVDQNSEKIPSYILPTLDGHFLYIDAESQILIDRKQVQQLLHVCFENEQRKKQDENSLQYFIYEKYEYYIINLNNGEVSDIQKILKNGIIPKLDRMAVLKVSKKYLKQIKSDYTIVWSTLSSELDLVPASLFLKNPEISSSANKEQLNNVKFELKRLGNNLIELVNGQQSFQIGGRGHIINIFSNVSPQKGFLKHQMKYHHKEVLALQDKSAHKHFPLYNPFDGFMKNQKPIFIHSDEIKAQSKNTAKNHDLEVCINTFRNLKALTDESLKGFINHKNTLHIHNRNRKDDNNSLSIKYVNHNYCNTTYQIVTYGPTKDQPYVWIAIMIGLITMIIAFITFKIKMMKSAMQQLNNRQTEKDKKLLQFENRLGKFEQLKKMYEVHWDKIIYQVAGDKWYQHIVFEGKFLNQEAIVYAVRQQGTDIISIQYKLNILLNFSHKGVAKLYYYTKNSQFLLIFTQKISPLSLKIYPEYFNLQINYQIKKNIIIDILQATVYLDNKIQIFELPHEAIDLNLKKIQAQPFIEYKLKINSVPCLLRKYFPQDFSSEDTKSQTQSFSLDNSTQQLRMNLVQISHLILHKGQTFDKAKIDNLLKDEAYSQDQYLQFYDFIMYEVKSKVNSGEKDIQGGPSQNLRELMFKQILDHPFLWDSKRKILFLSDFSNYIETHIDETKGKKLQLHARNYNIIKIPWSREFHFLFARQINSYRKYDHESVRDLIRVIRNKLSHFHQIPRETKQHIGVTPEGFVEYCLQLFPKLLHFAFVYARKKKWKLHMK